MTISTPFYACDFWAADWMTQIKAQYSGQSSNAYLLVDAGFNAAQGAHWLAHPEEGYVSLYAGTALADAADTGLFLGRADISSRDAKLLDHVGRASGLPMLSWVWSHSDLQTLALHWQDYLEVETPDGLAWPLRQGDTRCIPCIATMLKAEAPKFFEGFTGWSYFDRAGHLSNVTGQQTANGASPRNSGGPLPISDIAFARLVEDGAADEALMQLVELYPSLVQLAPASELYARLEALMSGRPMPRLRGSCGSKFMPDFAPPIAGP